MKLVFGFAVPAIEVAKGSTANLQTQMLPCGHDGFLDTKPFFLSSDLSDMAVECSGASFPVHRIILAGCSPLLFEYQVALKMTPTWKI